MDDSSPVSKALLAFVLMASTPRTADTDAVEETPARDGPVAPSAHPGGSRLMERPWPGGQAQFPAAVLRLARRHRPARARRRPWAVNDEAKRR